MLIQIKANCKNYSEVILKGFSGGQKSKGEFRCDNPDCRCDVFYIHGTYERHFLHFVEEPEPDDTVVFTLPGGLTCVDTLMTILRVRCTGCGVTHGIASADMIPFQVFSLPAFLTVILGLFLLDKPITERSAPTSVPAGMSWPVLKRMLLIYVDYRTRMMAALRQQGLYEAAPDLADGVLLRIYLGLSPPDGARLAYLRCHKQPALVNRQNTVSYPLRFILPAAIWG